MTDHRQRVEQVMRSFQERVDQVSQLHTKLQDMRGTGCSPDGAVQVTVAPSGAILDLRLTPSAMKRSHTALQQTILDTVREATRIAAQQMDAELEPILGDQLALAKQGMAASGVVPIGEAIGERPVAGLDSDSSSGSILR